jgi:hypothetical protein
MATGASSRPKVNKKKKSKVAALTVEREFWACDHKSRQSSLVRAHQKSDIVFSWLSAGGEAQLDAATMG